MALLFAALLFGSQAGAQTPALTPTPSDIEQDIPGDVVELGINAYTQRPNIRRRQGLTVMLPQQTTAPSERKAQVWLSPLSIAVYMPDSGGDACPCSSAPQHSIEPAVL